MSDTTIRRKGRRTGPLEGRTLPLEAAMAGPGDHGRPAAGTSEGCEALTALLNAITDSAFLIDTDGRILALNEVCAERLGKTIEEARGRCIFDLLPADVADSRRPRVQEAIRTGKPVHFDDRRGGMWLENSISPVLDAQGRVTTLAVYSRNVTRRKEIERSLRESEDRFQRFVESSNDIIFTADTAGRFTYANPATIRILRYAPRELVGKLYLDLIRPDFREEAARFYHTQFTQRIPSAYFEFPVMAKDGREVWLGQNLQWVKEGDQIVGSQAVARDVTERRRAQEALEKYQERLEDLVADRTSELFVANQALVKEIAERTRVQEELLKTNRTLKLISTCSQAVMHATGASVLLQDICRIIVDSGGYCFAWVGFAEQDEGRTVRPVAQSGHENGYLQLARITWADTERGRGPTGRAIRSGRPVLARNIFSDRDLVPWREEALKRGYSSSIALPLVAGDTVIGALNIYASEPGAFDAEEVKLLRELADDLTYGIMALRTSEERNRSVDDLRKERDRAQRYLDIAGAIIVALDRDGHVTLVNKRGCQVLGVSAEEAVGLNWFDTFVPPTSRDGVESAFRRLIGGETALVEDFENPILTWTRKERIIAWHNAVLKDEAGNVLGTLSSGEDITEQKTAEEELRQTAGRLQQAMHGTIHALTLMSEIRDPYTANHEQRTAEVACAIAKELGFSEWQIEGIRVAGLFHDIGKIYIPSEILTKPRNLTKIEFDMVKTHPQVGHEILRIVDFPWPISTIVLQHHERMDGSGYPHGIAGDEILLEARILAVADVVEVMISHRPYRPAFTRDDAVKEMTENRGKLYDPDVVDAFMRLFVEKGFSFAVEK